MALENFPGMSDATRSFIRLVREYQRDQPVLNRLIAGEESSDRQIAWAIVSALSYFNGCPPLIGRSSLEDLLNRDQTDLLLRLTVMRLLEGIALLQTRNMINASAGGTAIGINDKAPLLMRFIEMYRGGTEQMVLRVKVAMNITNAMGLPGVHSEYWAVNGTYVAY